MDRNRPCHDLTVSLGDYMEVFALPELDPRCKDDPVLLCETMNNTPLPPETGHLRMVLPIEKRHFRWVRNVAKIELRKVE